VPTPTDETALKLHVGPDGHVWYSAGFNTPRNSGHTVDAFLLSSVCSGGNTRVRLLGVANNAALITALYTRHREKTLEAVELAGPNVCESLDELSDSELVLHRMRAATLPSACGGWHVMSGADYATYALIARMVQNGNALDGPSRIYLRVLPVYRALSYVLTLSDEYVAQLIKTVVDPRWYVDRRVPERQGKLDLFMGLTPAVQKRVSDDEKLLYKPRDLRCATVLNAWKTVHPGAVDLNEPRNFLYRVHKSVGGGVRGDLRAGQTFLRYLRYNWLESLESRRGPRDRLFVPELFFKTPGEIESYLQHMAV
jgi:hypothetical protein